VISTPTSSTGAVDSAIAPVRAASLSIHARRFVARCVQGLTWQRVGVVIAFCALYASSMSVNPRTGGAPQSWTVYLTSFAAALALFFPAFVTVIVAASFAPQRLPARAIALGLAVGAGVALGHLMLGGAQELTSNWHSEKLQHVGSPLVLMLVGWLGLAIYLLQEREQAAEQALQDEEERRLELSRQMSEAQLQMLQSQIEPHFLFNSLAHVRRLYQTDAHAGRAMLQHLSRYLSATHQAMRERDIALGDDLELAITYLMIQEIRMGSRLAFEIDVPVELREARIPPMTVTTLVENAIKHGLSPLLEGGVVRIEAHRDGQALKINVVDSGQGFQANLGAGVGLANVRARLAMLHGAAARLSLSQNVPRGVTATIVVPMPFATSA
jgi:two-component sensor histidine kinase